MKTCNDCHKSEPEVEFTPSRKYNCKDCVRKRNQKYSLSIGCKLKFILKITTTHKQCLECKKMVELKNYSPSKRGRLGLSSYCKPCSSKRQLKRLTKEERKKAGLTQEEFAMRAGLGLRFVRELEQGKETVRLDKVNQALAMFGKEAVPGEREE